MLLKTAPNQTALCRPQSFGLRICFFVVAISLLFSGTARAAATNTSSELLLTDPLGKIVAIPTNEVPANLLPPLHRGMKLQIPSPLRGTPVPESAVRRMDERRTGLEGLQFLPSFQPRLMPYLAAQDEFGNTAIKPNPLIPASPLDVGVQQGKYWLSEQGLRYSLEQTFTFVSMSDVIQGDNVLGFYTFDFAAKWAVFSTADSSTAGWISAQIEAKTGLGTAADTQSAKSNLGSLTDPTGIWSSVNGFRIPEMAWQQSFRHGEIVVLAGMVSQGNYIDVNSYANSGRGQFLNSALINSMVMPLPNYNPGVNLQWQPTHDWYFMFGGSAGASSPGTAPWTDFTWETWAALWEIGYMPKDVFGLGPGVYRVQPFLAQADGPTQAGLCFNLEQQLGKEARFGWFGRFGFGGSDVSAGASAQIGTGFVMRGPLEYAGLFPGRKHDAAGIGFVWSQPSSGSAPVAHENEYALEAGYVLQLTPTAKLQPDIQVVWNPAYNSDAGPAVVFQLQLDLGW
jgi:carbohydrate-selective porin OprB